MGMLIDSQKEGLKKIFEFKNVTHEEVEIILDLLSNKIQNEKNEAINQYLIEMKNKYQEILTSMIHNHQAESWLMIKKEEN